MMVQVDLPVIRKCTKMKLILFNLYCLQKGKADVSSRKNKFQVSHLPSLWPTNPICQTISKYISGRVLHLLCGSFHCSS